MADSFRMQLPTSTIYYSGLQSREQNLEDYSNGKYNILICVDALNQGLNIPSIDAAICTSYTSVELTFIQQLSRTTRLKDYSAIFINLYLKDSVEESWLRKKTINISDVQWLNKDEKVIL